MSNDADWLTLDVTNIDAATSNCRLQGGFLTVDTQAVCDLIILQVEDKYGSSVGYIDFAKLIDNTESNSFRK